MEYIPPLGGDANDPYIDGDPSTGTEGSIPLAAAIEHPMREIVNAIVALGGTPDAEDLGQLGDLIVEAISGAGGVAESYIDGSVTITPGNDSDVVITSGQAGFGRLVLADGAWSDGRNIIVPAASRRFWIDNTAGSYDATVKTASGAGVIVPAGTARPVFCDGTDVIDPLPVSVLQIARQMRTDVATGTTQIPFDDTIPQDTEGDEYFSLSFTPKSASSLLHFSFTANVEVPAGSPITAALFVDGQSDAIVAGVNDTYNTGGHAAQVSFNYAVISGSTDPRTYRVRMGSHAANTLTLNGTAGSRKMGGVLGSGLVITEVGQ